MTRQDCVPLWNRALGELRGQMTEGTFDTWLRGSQVIGYDAGRDTMVVGVRHVYSVDWLGNRLARVIDRTLLRLADEPPAVEFVVWPPAGRWPAPPVRGGGGAGVEDAGWGSGPARAGPDHDGNGRGGWSTGQEERAMRATNAVGWLARYFSLDLAAGAERLPRLKGASLSVYLCLTCHADGDGLADPGIEALLRLTGYSRASVCRALAGLQSLELICKLEQRDRDQPDTYQLCWGVGREEQEGREK